MTTSRRHRAWRGYFAPIALVVLIGACDALGLDPKSDKERELERQRRVWQTQGIANYHYVLQRSCFCGGEFTSPLLVTVRAGAVISVVYVSDGGAVPTFAADAPSVTGLFDIVQRAIDDEVYQLTVEYHATLGYPISIGIDRAVNVADDEILYSASALLTLPAAP